MQIITMINNVRCLEWSLTANQGALFDMLNQSASWAKTIIIDDEVWYWVSRNKIIEELPLYFTAPDTVYRNFKALDKKGVIKHQKHGEKDVIMLTEKGKTWNNKTPEIELKSNSDSNPRDGLKSENTRIEIRNSSDSNPTYQHTNTSTVNNHKLNPTSGCLDYQTAKKFIDDFDGDNVTVDILVKQFHIKPMVAKSWAKVRKVKRAPLTPLAFKKFINQAEKAKLTIEQAIEICCDKSWAGFEAEWLTNSAKPFGNQQAPSANTNADGISEQHYSDVSLAGVTEEDLHVPF